MFRITQLVFLRAFGLLCAGIVAAVTGIAPVSAGDDGYVGSEACAGCHAEQFKAWQGSHHDLAMQVADSSSVLGDFSDTTFTQHGVTSRFFMREQRYFVNTENANGELTDFEIRYTFGVDPLQQYLVAFPNGALQTLGIAWDTRPTAQGGQRWFHVYGDERIAHDDELHWTGRNQTWNYQCADCHSLNVRKNYDADSDTYATTWDVIDVGCEGCHGPAAEHVRLAPGFDGAPPHKGLTHSLADTSGGEWRRAADEPIAHRTAARDPDNEINSCARCHSRRSQLHEQPFHGQSFLDDYRPALITPGLYHLDGQINDEVYVYGSFLQSRMHKAGVVCSDCHDPHSGKTRADDNSLCTQCHRPETYDVAAHHHHAADSPGAACVECHMPATNYMVIDARRDHSLRSPRPELSAILGTPNACNRCHTGQSSDWAAGHVAGWAPAGAKNMDYGVSLAITRGSDHEAMQAALALTLDERTPSMVRATAAQTLGRYPPRSTLEALAVASAHDEPLLRLGAIAAVDSSVMPLRLQVAVPNTYDNLLSVRVAAARALAAIPADQIPEQTRETVAKATTEAIETLKLQSDHPGALASLGHLYTEQGDFDRSEQSYRRALEILPGHLPATIGLADTYRAAKRDADGEQLLEAAVLRRPDSPDLHHALGLLQVRQRNADAAVTHLARAAKLDPGSRRYQYVLAVARRSYGQSDAALAGLEPVAERFPEDIQILLLLSELHFENGDIDKAIEYAEEIVSLAPDDPRALEFLRGLSSSRQ